MSSGDRRDRGSAPRDAVVILGVLVLLGAACGAVWSWLVQPAEFTKLAHGSAMGEDALGQRFGADGWYVVVAIVAGILAGTTLMRWRGRAPLRTVGLLLLGSCVAAVLAAWVGHLLGPADPARVLATARVGTHVPEQLDVGAGAAGPSQLGRYLADTLPVYLCWPAAVLLGALFVLAGSGRDGPEDDPGRAPDPGHQAF
jgi:hypothetical protein